MKNNYAVFERDADGEWKFGGFIEHDEQAMEAEESAEDQGIEIMVVDLR